MFVYGVPDLERLALLARIEAADDTLELGQFLYHLGREIAFGKRGCPRAHRDAGANGFAELPRELDHALRSCRNTNPASPGNVTFFRSSRRSDEFPPQIDVPEEARIVETGAKHAFISRAEPALPDRNRCSLRRRTPGAS